MKKQIIKRGRPIGATSTVRVKMKDLQQYLTPEATVVVGKSWLEEIGFGIAETEVSKIQVVKPTEENTVIEAKDLNLED